MKRHSKEQGFTLVELAIVLVIIGLIVGGVLVGQDLIKAAEVRSAISDFERYNSAVNTFRTKYNGIPGDLQANRATAFGLTARTGGAGRGDGDGIVESGALAAGADALGHETELFWRDLSDSTLVAESFTTGDDGTPVAIAAADISDYLPSLRLRDTAFIHVYGTAGRNFYQLAEITAVVVTTGAITEAAALTPLEALQFDEKIDDGGPITGIAVAVTATETLADGTTNDACVDGTVAGDPYNTLTQAEQDTIGCILRVRAQF